MPSNRVRKSRKMKKTSVNDCVFKYFANEFDWVNANQSDGWEIMALETIPGRKLEAWKICRTEVLNYLKNKPGSKRQLMKLNELEVQLAS